MTRLPLRLVFVACASVLAAGPVLASEAVVAPLLPRDVNSLVALNITSLVASEMDFMSEFDNVEQLEDAPGTLNVSCLHKASCLGAIGRNAGADRVVAGAVAKSGREAFDVFLVLFDVNQNAYIRKQNFVVASAPEQMADTMGGVVRELVTGVSPEQREEAATVASAEDFMIADEDEFDFDDFEESDDSHRVSVPGNSQRELEDFGEEDPFDTEMREREEEAQRRQAEAQRRAVEEARLRAEEEERQRRNEEVARRRAAEEDRFAEIARREEEARRAELDDIQFGSPDPEEIGIDDFQFGSAVALIDEESDDGGYEISEDNYDDMLDLDDIDPYGDSSDLYAPLDRSRSIDTLDEPDPYTLDEEPEAQARRSSSRSSRSRSSSGSTTRIQTQYHGASDKNIITVRGGISSFQSLSFVTYGVEMDRPLSEAVSFRASIEGYSVERDVPLQLQKPPIGEPGGVAGGRGMGSTVWNTITPLSLGMAWHGDRGPLRPYIGADLTVVPYAKSGLSIAPGARARFGTDYMLTQTFGLNVNLAAGFWYGANFDLIAEDLSAFGMAPQVSIGTVFAI